MPRRSSLHKLRFTLHAQHVALPHCYPFYAETSGTSLRFLFVGPWLLLPLGLTGLAVAAPTRRSSRGPSRGSPSFPLYALAVAVFFVAERYRLPLLVPLCIGAGAVIAWAGDVWRSGGRMRLLAPGVAVALLMAAVNWPTVLKDGRWEEGLRLAQHYVIAGDFAQADEWMRRAEAWEPRPGATKYGVAAQLALSGQHERALPYLQQALAAEGGGRPETHYAVGQALLRTGRAEEAIPHLRRGLDAGIELPGGGYDLAAALQEAGEFEAAASVLRRIHPPDAEGADGLSRFGRLALQVQAANVAEPLFRRAAALKPDDPAIREQLGQSLLILRRYEDAAAELSVAVRLGSADAELLSRLAFCELKLGRLDQARQHTAEALRLDPRHTLSLQLSRELRMQ